MPSRLQRLRRAWLRRRPLPAPAFRPGTPRIDAPQIPNPMTLREAATSPDAVAFAIELLGKLTPSKETGAQQQFYREAQEQFGRYLRYADLTTVLWAAATLIRPRSYLEIGVRNGRSSAVVGAVSPDCAIYGFDLWQPGYFADPTQGPDFVRDELRRVGHRGPLELVSGDSMETVPAFLREHPELFFDLVTIDGAKYVAVVASDIGGTLPRLKVGGIIVTDDIAFAPPLLRVWRELIGGSGRFIACELTGAGAVTAAVRFSDEPWGATLRNVAGGD
jgi:predicted O-methyltransferase YrrM